MIEPPPKDPTLQEAAEWMVRALRDEEIPILLGGRSAIDYQGEYTGSVDVDLLIGADFKGANDALGVYVSRGDLFPAGATEGSVVRYLVSGWRAVDVMDVSDVDARLFRALSRRASVPIRFGSAGEVRAVTREGYFVLAILIGKRGFARRKADPMAKVREAWGLFGARTDRRGVERLLAELGEPDALKEALAVP